MRLFTLFTAALVSLASCTLGSAQTMEDKAGRVSKVAPELISLYDEYSSYLTSHSAKPFQPANPLVRVIDSRVVVDTVASGEGNALKADLVSLGMQKAVAFGRVVSGELPICGDPRDGGVAESKFRQSSVWA